MNTAELVGGLPAGFDPNVWGKPRLPLSPQSRAAEHRPGNAGDSAGWWQRSAAGQPAAAGPADQSERGQSAAPRTTRCRTSRSSCSNSSNSSNNSSRRSPRSKRPAASRRSRSGSTSARTATSICRRPTETRLVTDEVVLQMPCNVPQAALDDGSQAAQSDGARLAVPRGGRQRRLPDALRQRADDLGRDPRARRAPDHRRGAGQLHLRADGDQGAVGDVAAGRSRPIRAGEAAAVSSPPHRDAATTSRSA